MTTFNFNDPKYHSCCCGAHITKLARVLMVLDIIRVFFMGKFFFFIPLLIVCVGAYGVLAENRPCLIIYIILALVSTMLYAILLLVVVSAKMLDEDFKGFRDPGNFHNLLFHFVRFKRNQIPFGATKYTAQIIFNVIVFVIFLGCDIPFIVTYGNLAQFIKDRDMALPPIGYHAAVIYQHV